MLNHESSPEEIVEFLKLPNVYIFNKRVAIFTEGEEPGMGDVRFIFYDNLIESSYYQAWIINPFNLKVISKRDLTFETIEEFLVLMKYLCRTGIVI